MIARTYGNVQSADCCKGDRWESSGTQFPNEASRGNCVPEFWLETGYGFPNRPLAENASRNRRSNWDAVSGRQDKTKLRWNSSWLRLHPAKSGTIPPQLKLTNGSQGGPPMLRNNGRAFALSMKTEGDAPGLRAGVVRGEFAHVLPKLRVEGRGRGQVLPRVWRVCRC